MKHYILLFCLALGNMILAGAQSLPVYHAHEIKPYHAHDLQTDSAHHPKAKPAHLSPDYFIGVYHYWVPGTAYTTDDYVHDQRTLHTSAGTGILPGSLRINRDGSYDWNSSWEKRRIRGRWKATGDNDYPLILLNAQEGRNWKVGRPTDRAADILIWDGSTWYEGRKL